MFTYKNQWPPPR